MFAFTIFSLIAVAGLSLMNQGVSMAQRSLEVGLVRQQIDAQADALRYLNRAYVANYGQDSQGVALWREVAYENRVEQAQPFDKMSEGNKCHVPSDVFALDVQRIDTDPLLRPTQRDADMMPTYARINRDTASEVRAEGIWVQAVRSAESASDSRTPGFYDFHIRACWHAPGQQAPMTMGTIVRLYEPRG